MTLALALLAPFALVAPQASGSAEHVQVPKIEIRIPVLNTKKSIEAFNATEGVTRDPRYRTTESRDDLERTKTESLSICVKSLLGVDLKMDIASWQFDLLTKEDGEQVVDLNYFTTWTAQEGALERGTALDRESFELLYRCGETLTRVKAKAYKNEAVQTFAHRSEAVKFQLKAPQVLEMADAALLRLKFENRSVDLTLDKDDIEALRWFVWEKIKGGKDLIRARYTIIEKAKAEPASAPKGEAPKPAPIPTPKPEEKPKQMAA